MTTTAFPLIHEVTAEQLDKALLPLTTAGKLDVRYSETMRTMFYRAPGGRLIALTRDGKHYANVEAAA